MGWGGVGRKGGGNLPGRSYRTDAGLASWMKSECSELVIIRAQKAPAASRRRLAAAAAGKNGADETRDE